MRSAGVLAVGLLVVGAGPGGARALDLVAGLGSPVYVEDFEGELAFPLSPEVDPLGFGGMVGHRVGAPLPLLPTLSGGELLIAVSESAVATALLQSSGGAVAIEPPPNWRIGLLGRFDGFEAVRDATNGQFTTVTVTLLDSALANGAAGYLLDFQSGALRLAVSSVGGILTGYDDVFLSATAEDAIRAGDPFEIELLFDQTARTAQASLTVAGETFRTGATSSPPFDALQPDQALVANTTTNNDPPPASVASDVQDFSIYVPAPDGAAPALACVGVLALRRRRR